MDDFLDVLSTADNGIDDLLVLSIMIIDKGMDDFLDMVSTADNGIDDLCCL